MSRFICVVSVLLLQLYTITAIHQNLVPHRARHTTFDEFDRAGALTRQDPFEHVRSIIDNLDKNTDPKGLSLHDVNENDVWRNYQNSLSTAAADIDGATSFVEVSAQVGRVRSYCEICILIMQMKQRGQPHLCAGLNALHYVTCIENLESLLRADKALVYWLKNGCMHMDSTGPEIVRPCPALPVCSWVPNLFAQPPSLVRDGVESLCPKDPKFLPTIPNEYKTLLQPQTAAVPGAQQPT